MRSPWWSASDNNTLLLMQNSSSASSFSFGIPITVLQKSGVNTNSRQFFVPRIYCLSLWTTLIIHVPEAILHVEWWAFIKFFPPSSWFCSLLYMFLQIIFPDQRPKLGLALVPSEQTNCCIQRFGLMKFRTVSGRHCLTWQYTVSTMARVHTTELWNLSLDLLCHSLVLYTKTVYFLLS